MCQRKQTAEFSVKHMNSSSCSAAKVICTLSLLLYICVSLLFLHLCISLIISPAYCISRCKQKRTHWCASVNQCMRKQTHWYASVSKRIKGCINWYASASKHTESITSHAKQHTGDDKHRGLQNAASNGTHTASHWLKSFWRKCNE